DDARAAFRARGPGTLPPFPVAVLADGGTASAAEVLAGALRGAGRATVVGSRTYGKSAVQSVLLLEDGSALKMTTARFLIPSLSTAGRGFAGLLPDVPAEGGDPSADGPPDPGGDPALRAALGVLRERAR
ncbi:MAG: S41 family peptidase, partial [Planctomycetes bacterium]|nr:S41 family peptidase [Planctomycetota bacterium]